MSNDNAMDKRLEQAKQSLTKKRYDDAIQQYQVILLIDASNVAAMEGLARALIGAHRPMDAIAVCEKALAQNPDLAVFHYLLGYIYDHNGRQGEAERELRRSLELDPSSINAKLTLAALLGDCRSLEESNRIYREVLTIDQENDIALMGQAMNLARMGKHREAARMALRAFWLKPSLNNLKLALAGLHEAYPWGILVFVTLSFLFIEVNARTYAAFCAAPVVVLLGTLAFGLYHLPRKVWAGIYLVSALLVLTIYTMLK